MMDDRTAIGDALERRSRRVAHWRDDCRTGRRPPRCGGPRLPSAPRHDRRRRAWPGGGRGSPRHRVHLGRDADVGDGGEALRALHVDLACRAYLDGAERLALPTDAVPQLAEVSRRLQRLTGWRFHACAGAGADPRVLRRPRRAALPVDAVRAPPVGPAVHPGARRHPRAHRPRQRARRARASPTCTRSPAPPGARRRARRRDRAAAVLADVLVHARVRRRPRGRRAKAYGAGLLSSYGEIQEFRQAEIRTWDPDEMARTEYDIDVYQPVLFAAPSFDAMVSRSHHLVRRRRPLIAGQTAVVLLDDNLRGIEDGTITLVFRRWRRPTVKDGRDPADTDRPAAHRRRRPARSRCDH